jgi:glycosyltransferase involved in cell wall biosynthesis
VPRTVIAAPLYNNAAYLPEAVGSLLAQTDPDLALLLIDDRSTDDTVAVARRLAAADPRVAVHVNEQRLGMLGNTRRALALARERHPEATYFALASDHDRWEPRWLETLAGALAADPGAVLAYPHTQRIGAEGELLRGPWSFDTRDDHDVRRRLRRTYKHMVAGDMIYGLFRLDALAEIGELYQPVLVPDRLLLGEVALRGRFLQVPEVLWSRRFRGLASLERQRQAFWPAGPPAYARRPWWLVQSGLFFWRYAVLGVGRPRIGRAAGAVLAGDYIAAAARHRAWRRGRRLRKRLRRYAPRRLVRRARAYAGALVLEGRWPR